MSFDEIIMEIQDNPVLWMSDDPNYKNRLMKANLWDKLARKLGMEEFALKKKWKYLKDQYRKELKKRSDSASGTEDTDLVSSWKYFERLEFLRHEVLPGPSSGDLNATEFEGNVESFVASPAPSQSSEPPMFHPRPVLRRKRYMRDEILEIERKKMKLVEEMLSQSNEEDNLRNDADYLFLRSILPTMKKLSEYQKLSFRGKINDWLLQTLAPGRNANA